MFMVLSSWHSHCESSPGSFDEYRTAPRGTAQYRIYNGANASCRNAIPAGHVKMLEKTLNDVVRFCSGSDADPREGQGGTCPLSPK